MNKINSPININQEHNYHSNDNAPNEHNLQPIHTYNTKNTPISNNAQHDPQNPLYPQSAPTKLQHTANHPNKTTSSQLHTPMKLPHCTTNNQPTSTINVEQRNAGKQPCNRQDETSYNTAPTYTNQARTQPCFSGTPTQSNTAQTLRPTQAVTEDPFMTRRGTVPRYSTTKSFMFFNQHTVNVILQHPTIDDPPYYQAALEAHKTIANLTAATIS